MSPETVNPMELKELRDTKIVDELQSILDQRRATLNPTEIEGLQTAIAKGRSALSKGLPMSEEGFFTLYTLSQKYKPKESPEKN